ncbi:AbiV family abortive infection protein [Streptomyces exfoliatus]|uniref:AbiV family abortive infection protein n=1 Tax=Streptomyces exfoliatus TaxID=1905 RepID=UPI003C30AECA
MPPQGPPDVGREALKHARELLRAARLILDAKIWSVAYANAALALEEVGKAALCTSILPMPDYVRQAEVDAFPKRFASHEAKSFLGFLVVRMVEDSATADWMEIYKRADRDARRTNKNKFRGLYVDYKHTGLLKPADVTEAQAADLIATVERALELSLDTEDALENVDLFMPLIRMFRTAHGGAGALAEDDMLTLLPTLMAIARGEVDAEEALEGTALAALVHKFADSVAAKLTPEQVAAIAAQYGDETPAP